MDIFKSLNADLRGNSDRDYTEHLPVNGETAGPWSAIRRKPPTGIRVRESNGNLAAAPAHLTQPRRDLSDAQAGRPEGQPQARSSRREGIDRLSERALAGVSVVVLVNEAVALAAR